MPHPVTPLVLRDRLTALLHAASLQHGTALRVALDGVPGSGAAGLCTDLVEPLRALGRDAVRVSLEGFLRPASLRYEHGREDPDAYFDGHHDLGALRREVLDPLAPGGSGRFLPSRWDPVTDRATRAAYLVSSPATVVLLDGPFLLRRDMADAWDVTIHLALSPPARRRRVPAELAPLVLAAATRYDEEHDPAGRADVVVRADDARHPALVVRGS